MNDWRLILHPPSQGAWNMAVDEAILESVVSKTMPPTMRLYDWSPYTLSLGYAQPFSDVDSAELKTKGWDVVRRPTGGRAILHADEMTYSICAPEDDAHVSGNVLESYRILSSGLLRALELLGIQADSKPKSPVTKQVRVDPVCFQVPSDYEITCAGKKLIGSAQARRLHGVLQHGAIPLRGDISRIIEVLTYSTLTEQDAARVQLQSHATTLTEVLGRTPKWQEVAEKLMEGFESALGVNITPGTLSEDEKRRALVLSQEKYANDTWTKKL